MLWTDCVGRGESKHVNWVWTIEARVQGFQSVNLCTRVQLNLTAPSFKILR